MTAAAIIFASNGLHVALSQHQLSCFLFIKWHRSVCIWPGINYYEDADWMRRLPEGTLNAPISGVVHGRQRRSHLPDDSGGRRHSVDRQESIAEDTSIRERIVDKWNDLRIFCCRFDTAAEMRQKRVGYD